MFLFSLCFKYQTKVPLSLPCMFVMTICSYLFQISFFLSLNTQPVNPFVNIVILYPLSFILYPLSSILNPTANAISRPSVPSSSFRLPLPVQPRYPYTRPDPFPIPFPVLLYPLSVIRFPFSPLPSKTLALRRSPLP